mgnify:CR=1 FL=1
MLVPGSARCLGIGCSAILLFALLKRFRVQAVD